MDNNELQNLINSLKNLQPHKNKSKEELKALAKEILEKKEAEEQIPEIIVEWIGLDGKDQEKANKIYKKYFTFSY